MFKTGPTSSSRCQVEMSKTNLNKETGKKEYTAGRDLKKSENYPKGFGTAVRKVTLKNEKTIRDSKKNTLKRMMPILGSAMKKTQILNKLKHDAWQDAELTSVIGYLLK